MFQINKKFYIDMAVVGLLTIVVISLFIISQLNKPGNLENAYTYGGNSVGKVEVDRWQNIIKEYGGKQAYFMFKEEFLDEPSVGVRHTNAHYFGEALYRAVGISGLRVCDDFFGYGCLHSFMGFAMLDRGMGVINELYDICNSEVNGEIDTGCVHGLGHGLVVENNYENLEAILNECHQLTGEYSSNCSNGIYMEYNLHTMGDNVTRPLDESGYFFPCSELSEPYTGQCYYDQVSWWTNLTNNDLEFLSQKCSEIKDEKNREACYRGYGNVVASYLEYSDLSDIESACSILTEDFGRELCIERAVNYNNQPNR